MPLRGVCVCRVAPPVSGTPAQGLPPPPVYLARENLAPGSLWFGSFAPLDAQTRSLYVLSHPPGEPESFSRLLSYPCLLGTCKTRPETAGVLLCMCWLSNPFRAAPNPTKNTCKLLTFERRRAGSLCVFLSPVRFTALNACGSPPQALKCLAMRAPCPRVAFSVHPQAFMPLARCARPGGVWRVTRRFFVPVCPGSGPVCPGSILQARFE
jgi:hypothetical protein